MTEGIIYGPVLSKLISGLNDKEQEVLFEMEDGSLKTLNEVEDFHKVKTTLKHEVIAERILIELFGEYPKIKASLKPKHFDNFMALYKIILNHTPPSIIKRVAAKYNLSITFINGDEDKIASERLRE